MGYEMHMMSSNATLAVEDIPAAQDALLTMPLGRYDWIDPNWQQSGDIIKMLREWRYSVYWDETGGIGIDNFEGEKFGSDEKLWNALAPHMRGSITMMGEDGESWRWVLGGEKLETLEGRTVFE